VGQRVLGKSRPERAPALDCFSPPWNTITTKMKRALQSSDSENTSEKVPRRQDLVSCQFCRQKKLKCDRGSPCSNCRARKLTFSSSVARHSRPNINLAVRSVDRLDSDGSNSSRLVPLLRANHPANTDHRLASQLIDELNDRVKRLESLLVSNSKTTEDIPDTRPHHPPTPQKKHQTPREVELTKTVTWLENDAIAHYQPKFKCECIWKGTRPPNVLTA
jgi:hypothetical protein